MSALEILARLFYVDEQDPEPEPFSLAKERAICAGLLRCPRCNCAGPHQDNGKAGKGLGFECIACEHQFLVSDYGWEPECTSTNS